ncbi:MAG: DUF6989 domain-containing protein [Nevskiales bacterium]
MHEHHLARALQFYAGYGVLCALLLLLPVPLAAGAKVLLLVIVWNLLLPLAAWRLGYSAWLRLWLFLVPLSIFQIFADWFFCDSIKTLSFADNGSPLIGPVPIYMAGMWSIGLFLLVLIGQSLAWTSYFSVTVLAVALASVAIFFPTEMLAFHLPLWKALDVPTTLHVANYIVPAEILLGVSTFLIYEQVQAAGWPTRLFSAAGITLMYTGAAGVSYLFLGRG